MLAMCAQADDGRPCEKRCDDDGYFARRKRKGLLSFGTRGDYVGRSNSGCSWPEPSNITHCTNPGRAETKYASWQIQSAYRFFPIFALERPRIDRKNATRNAYRMVASNIANHKGKIVRLLIKFGGKVTAS